MSDSSPPIQPSIGARWPDVAAFAVLVFATAIYVLPQFANAPLPNSDVAVVGLQAMHLLRGEWAATTWGVFYQGILYPLVHAACFLLTGPSGLSLVASSFAAFVIVQAFLYATLRRRLGIAATFVLCLLTAFICSAASLWVFHPRFWCLAIMFGALWLVDGANRSSRPVLCGAAAALLIVFADYVDAFAAFLAPGVIVLAICAAFDQTASSKVRTSVLVSFFACLVVSGLAFLIIRSHMHLTQSFLMPDAARRLRNLNLLWTQCLPYMLGTKWFHLYTVSTFQPDGLTRVLVDAAAGLCCLLYVAGIGLVADRSIAWEIRRLAVCALVMAVVGVTGFTWSHFTTDINAVRYLSGLILTAPFAMAPAAARWGVKLTSALLLPFLVASIAGGAISQGYSCATFHDLADPASLTAPDRKLGEFLEQRGVTYAASDYWTAYRLTFVLAEKVIVVPSAIKSNRYDPYALGFMRAPRIAYVFPSTPATAPALASSIIYLNGPPREAYENVYGYLVFIYDRKPAAQAR
ncbi:MAG: hypothetical protein P4L33_14320 [Capsulimonadaceae bacterium]|nr:hypothetical protein [Capsulimonadaceae bacterium]